MKIPDNFLNFALVADCSQFNDVHIPAWMIDASMTSRLHLVGFEFFDAFKDLIENFLSQIFLDGIGWRNAQYQLPYFFAFSLFVHGTLPSRFLLFQKKSGAQVYYTISKILFEKSFYCTDKLLGAEGATASADCERFAKREKWYVPEVKLLAKVVGIAP